GETLSEGMDKAKEVASEVYGAAKEEADRQGFTGGKPLSEKVTEVAKAAGGELKSAAERTIGDLEEGQKDSASTKQHGSESFAKGLPSGSSERNLKSQDDQWRSKPDSFLSNDDEMAKKD